MAYNIDALKGELVGFEQAGLICKIAYNAESKLINLVFPHIILTAFSCEITIKGIYYLFNNKELKIKHSLKFLFGKLDTTIQDEIKSEIHDFDNLLNQNDTVFEDWRYLYEKTGQTSVSMEFLENFYKALKKKLDNMVS